MGQLSAPEVPHLFVENAGRQSGAVFRDLDNPASLREWQVNGLARDKATIDYNKGVTSTLTGFNQQLALTDATQQQVYEANERLINAKASETPALTFQTAEHVLPAGRVSQGPYLLGHTHVQPITPAAVDRKSEEQTDRVNDNE